MRLRRIAAQAAAIVMCRHFIRRVFSFLLAISLILPQGAQAVSAGTAVYTFSGSDCAEHSVYALHRAWKAIQVPERRFDELPSVAYPYRLGRLNAEFLRQNVDMLNFFRLCAGLPAVDCTEADNTDAQHGAVLLAAAGTLDHSPSRPPMMSGEFYERGCGALRSANISAVLPGGADAAAVERNKLQCAVPMVFRGYMDGSGAYGRSSASHRRWILYPDLQAVGVGCADAADSCMYQVLKLNGTPPVGAEKPDYDFISWPASGVFPTQAISPDAPWSVTLNPEYFRTPVRSALSITVTRLSDGKAWILNGSSSADSADSSFLIVDTRNYGVDNCILFGFPSGQTERFSGDYRVCVTGLTLKDGREAALDYQMQFVDLENCAQDWTDWITDSQPTCTADGAQHRLCRECGEREERILPRLGHDWELCAVVEESGKYSSGSAEYVCARCGERKLEALPLMKCRDEGCPCSGFADAPARDNWAHNGIDFVVENGIFNGTGANTFSPKGKMTRAMLVTVLWRIAGRPKAKQDYTFRDVDGSAYYAPAVRWASENGVVNGYSAERFGPSDDVTREQAVTLLQRFFAPDAAASCDMAEFSDAAAVHDYAKAPMRWAIEHRVITGMTDASGALCLMPGSSITREQTASVIMRCMMNLSGNQPDGMTG